MMKVFHFLLLVLFATTIYAEDSSLNRVLCRKAIPPSFPRVTQYLDSHSIETAGKQTTVYAQFAGNEYWEVLKALEKDSDAEALGILHGILQKYNGDIERDLGQELVRSVETGEVQWIGVGRDMVELLRGESEVNHIDVKSLVVSSIQEQRRRLNQRFGSYPDWSDEKMEGLLHLLYGRVLVVMATQPQSFNGVRLVFLGDKQLSRESAIIFERLSNLTRIILDMQRNMFVHRDFRFHALDTSDFEEVISERQREEILDELDREGLTEIRSIVEGYINMRNRWSHLNNKQGKIFANNISKQEGQGIAILAHRAGVLKGLGETNSPL